MRKPRARHLRIWLALAAVVGLAAILVVPAHALERSTDTLQLDDVDCGGGVTYDLYATGTFLSGDSWQKIRWTGWVEANTGEQLRLSHSWIELYDVPSAGHVTISGRPFGLYGDGESIVDRGVVVLGPNGPVFRRGQFPFADQYGLDPHAATCALLTN